MSRSKHNGCGKALCGVCKPHKKWGKGKKEGVDMRTGDRRNAPREPRLEEYAQEGMHITNE